MTSFNKERAAQYDRVQRQQYYRSNFSGLTAYERHNKYIQDYFKVYGASGVGVSPSSATVKTDFDILRESYRFIRTESDDAVNTWEGRLARKYYNKLFREYAIVDLSRYKENKIGMRWRSQKEVVDGTGQFICGAKGCAAKDGLGSYEVNFAYVEDAERKQALVKVRLCPECAFKLNYRKNKELGKRQPSRPSDSVEHQTAARSSKRARHRHTESDDDGGHQDEDKAEGSAAATAAAASTEAQPAAGGAILSADESVWEQRPQEEGVVPDEEYAEYFDGLFL